MENRAIISIDMDKNCIRCKKPGATQSGLCLGCIAKDVTAGKFDHILKRNTPLVKRPGGAGETAKGRE